MSTATNWGEEELDNDTLVVEYRTNEKGERVKVTKTIKHEKHIKRIPRRVDERRKRWVKFGKCKGVEGLELGISGVAEPVLLVLGDDAKRQKELEEKMQKDKVAVGEIYRTLVQDVSGESTSGVWRPSFKSREPTAGAGGPPRGDGVYVPVHLRNRTPGSQPSVEETTTIRVTNLSEETTERDLDSMFKPFGPISRIYLAKDRDTGLSIGYAFINYLSRRDAQSAMDALDGKGWDYLILSIEWAKPSKRD
eukprot:TRINITY_DN12384_c0_g1_i1.p1 TRINITY_DN12384_c0_g1~~TRINITY_DN12384_c0_g1_i1.p1  ORF type:complete len:257 (+),score=62.20 TRINITY_DN12384_c0_g1_i1:24-773(+)